MRSIRIAAAAVFALSLATSEALAQGRGNGDGKGKAKAAVVRTSGGDVHVRSGRKVPPGLAKKGGMPPGQAKKYGTGDGLVVLREVLARNGYTVIRVGTAGEARYVYYRLRNGPARRAVIRPGDRLVFVNVPGVVLREVMARLY